MECVMGVVLVLFGAVLMSQSDKDCDHWTGLLCVVIGVCLL